MRPLVVAALLPLVLVACGGIDTHAGERSLNRREIAPGPGLFTGGSGAWIILRRDLPSLYPGDAVGEPSNEGTSPP